MSSRIKIGAFLALAIVLAMAFVVLLLVEMRRRDEIAATTSVPKPYALTPVPPEEYPVGTPTDPTPAPSERFGGEFPRWNLKDFPKGWDPALAGTIHAYFEAMSVGLDDEEKLAQLGKLREEFAALLAKLGPEAVPTLAAILNAEGDFVNRRFILKALGNLGPQSEAATFALLDFFMARHADPRNRSEMWHVIDAMKSLGNDSSLSVLGDLVRNPAPEIGQYRRYFIEALGDHPQREAALGVFVDHLHSDKETNKIVRNKAAQALGKVRSPAALNDLYQAASQETYVFTKQTILGSIGKIGSPNSIPFLEQQYRDALAPTETTDELHKRDNVLIRQSAARAISRVGTPYAFQVVRELAKTEPDEKTREYMVQWAGGGEGQPEE